MKKEISKGTQKFIWHMAAFVAVFVLALVKIAASEPVARRKRATHAGEVSHAISRKKLHGKI